MSEELTEINEKMLDYIKQTDKELWSNIMFTQSFAVGLSLGIVILWLQQTYFILSSTTSIEFGILHSSNPFHQGRRASDESRY